MKVLFISFVLFFLAFSSAAHFSSSFIWKSNTELINSFSTTDNTSKANKNKEMFSFQKLNNDVNQNSFFNSFINKFSHILNVKNYRNRVTSDVVEELPASNIGYHKLKQIDFAGHLKVSKPVKLNYTEVLMAISEFKVYQGESNQEVTIGLDFLSNQEIRIFSSTGKLMTSIIIGDIDKAFVELDISNYPSGSYFAFDGESRAQFLKR